MFEEALKVYPDQHLIPVSHDKRALVKDWSNLNHDPYEWIDRYGNSNVAIIPVDFVVVDIDVEDKELQKKILTVLENYPTPVTRMGNPKRLPSRFYARPDTHPTNKKIKKVIEYLNESRYCVIPPSIHPATKKPYQWIGGSLDQHLDHLPEFSHQMWQELEQVMSGVSNESVKGVGRHNTLFEIACAMIGRNETAEEVVDELLNYDENNHEKPYFTDKSEAHKGLGRKSAEKMYASALGKAVQSGQSISKPAKQITIGQIIEPKKKERIKFPHFRGVAQEAFEYIYENADVPRTRMAIASTLSLMGTILSNKLNIGGKTYTNIYNLMVLHSGGGKNMPLNFPKNFLAFNRETKHLVGHSQPSSDTGIMKTLSNQNVRIDTIDEATKLFMAHKGAGNNIHMAKIIDIYTELYSATGHKFAGKSLGSSDKLVGECDSPCISIIAATTPEGFQQAFDKDLITKGLGARFMYWYDDKEKYSKFQLGKANKKPVPRNLINFASYWANFKDENCGMDLNKFNTSHTIDITDKALEALRDSHEAFNRMQSKAGRDAVMRSIYARAFEQMQKIVLIDAASSQYGITNGWRPPRVTLDCVTWSARFMTNYIKMMREFINDSLPDQFDNKLMVKFANLIKDCEHEGISRTHLYKKTAYYCDNSYRNKLIKSLIESERVHQIMKGNSTFYIHSNFIKK